MNKTTLAIVAALSAAIALGDDFKTIDGKEYKNATLSRVEPDGIVIAFSGGIVKLPFAELSPEPLLALFNDADQFSKLQSLK